jgi:predicted nuclease of predicted toxin-antitoxin system
MFLANENFPRPSTILLRENGYIVKSIQEDYSGIDDVAVIKMAQEQNLIILTFDRDYGELIFKYAKDNPPSVVFFRAKGSQKIFLAGAFTVIESDNIRQRFYKS